MTNRVSDETAVLLVEAAEILVKSGPEGIRAWPEDAVAAFRAAWAVVKSLRADMGADTW